MCAGAAHDDRDVGQQTGSAINFVHDQASWNVLTAIQRAFNKPINELPADPELLDQQLQALSKA